MKKQLSTLLVGLLLLVSITAACAPATTPTPAVVEWTVEVERTVEVEKPVVVTATPEPTQPPAPVTITYFTFSAAPDHLEDLDEMIQIFEQAHPNIKIKVETAAWEDYFTKLQTLIAGGTAPDVFELNYENFVSFASKGVLLDLDPLAGADEAFDRSIFYPRAYDAFNYNEMQLGLPETFSTVVLFYNKDLFDEAGLDYPAEDWTWDDAVTAAQELTDAEAGVWGLYSPIQFWEFYKKAAQNGCSFFNEDKTEVTINAPECVEALETMVSFVTEEGVMPSDAEMGGMADGDMFKAGQIAMDVTGIWMFAAFQDAPFAWDIQVEPGLEQHATHFFANTVSIFAATDHPQEAWEWVKFFTSSPEMAHIRVESGWELPALDNPAYFEDYLEQTPPDNREAVFQSLEYAIVPPVIERQNEMQDIVNQLLDQVKLGQLTPQEALDQAKVQIEELLR
ncbi:MAG: sugar ABC transporter substrate-binding protein [Chloroflexi bacterium]|nr:MAG: sugar ABC transporter substrate-binding protein [Chloroflexota bacterium]